MPDDFEGFEGYSTPHYTQIPDLFLDKHLRLLTGAEVKVMLALFRATIGWRQDSVRLSLRQLVARTGLSRTGVRDTVPRLEAKGLILVRRSRTSAGDSDRNCYAVRWRDDRPTPVSE